MKVFTQCAASAGKKSLLFITLLLCAGLPFTRAAESPSNELNKTFVSLHVQGQPLSVALQVIETQTVFRFVYNSKKIDANRKINIVVEKMSLAQLLPRLLEAGGIEYHQINDNLVLSKKSVRKQPSVIQGIGNISGRITDRKTGEPLAGAVIEITENNVATAANVQGAFSFVAVPSGMHQIRYSFVGYGDTLIATNIQDNQTQVLDIRLSPANHTMQTVVIAGGMLGQLKAINQQKSSNTIKNVISADQIGKFPDPNAAEALQRVPGVNINRNEGDGEGRYVGLRGLPPSFTNVNINGEQTPSPEGDVRQTALDVIPADQLASMEIIKALTPDMDGDAISGSVNLITKGAMTRDLKISGTLGTELQQNNPGSPGQQYALMIAKRFGGKNSKDGKFGFLANATYLQSNRNVDQVESSYDASADKVEFEEYELEDAYYIRKRLGLSGRLDFKPNDRTEIYLNGIFTQLYELDESRRYGFSVADNEIFKRIKHRQENQGVQSYNLGAKHLLAKMKLDYEVSYARGNEHTPYEYLPVFGAGLDEVVIDRSNTDRPRISSATLNGTNWDWNNDGNYKFVESEHSGTSARSRNYTGKFNIELPWSNAKNDGSIKFGAKVRGAERRNQMDFYHLYEFAGDDADNPALNTNGFTTGGDRSFKKKLLGGDYQLTPSVEYQNVHRYIDNNPDQFEDAGADGMAEESANRDYHLRENVYAGYVMSTINIKKWMFLGGVRYEHTGLKIRTQYWDEENETPVPVNNNKDYSFLLPMLHVRYNFTASSILRFAATSTYARPNFVDYVSDDKVFSESDKEAYIGNPDLKPVSALNLDLMYEKYIGSGGLFSAGVFHKSLRDFIYVQTRNITFNGVPDIDVYQSVNGGNASVSGFEVAYQRNLTFLPGWMKGFGVYANYTFTLGNATFTNRAEREDADGNKIVSEKVKLLPGQSKHIANFALSYSRGSFTGRATANYNARFISEVGINELSDMYVADRWQFDVSVSQRISKNFRAYVEGVNLTNATGLTYVGSRINTSEFRKFGTWGRVGIKFDF